MVKNKITTPANAKINATRAPPANHTVVNPIVNISITKSTTNRINQNIVSILLASLSTS